MTCVPENCAENSVDDNPRHYQKCVKIRLKNKGSQAHKRGPTPEHPETIQDLHLRDIHAKSKEALQRTLDVHHKFQYCQYSTGSVPSVALGIAEGALSLNDILTQRFA